MKERCKTPAPPRYMIPSFCGAWNSAEIINETLIYAYFKEA